MSDPGGLTVVSFSELTTAKRCSFKHQVAYVERWSKPKDPMSALGKGTAWHSVLETHYNEILGCQRGGVINREEIKKRCKLAVMPVIYGLPAEDLQDLIWWMYEGYVNLYGTDEDWLILSVEHPAEVDLPSPDGQSSRFRLKMKIDLVVKERSTGRIRIVDHKSGKDLPHRKALELDDQFPLYQWGLQVLGKRVFGLTYNAARTLRLQADIKEPGTTPLDERFSRESMHRTEKELRQVALEAYMTAETRYSEQARVKGYGMDSPRTTDTLRCPWDCDFYQQCLAGRKGMDWRDYLHHSGFEQQFERH